MHHSIKEIILFGLLMAISFNSLSQLKSLNDEDLSNATGQSSIKIDHFPIIQDDTSGLRLDGSDKNTSFTRITLGANIDINANIDKLQIGIKDRTEEALTNDRILNPELAADVDLENLQLGRIIADSNGVPTIEDLKIRDPYLEFARNQEEEIVGLRLGFKHVDGHVGLSINALSGDIAATGYVGEFNVPVLEGLIDALGVRDPDTGLLAIHPYSNGIRTNRLDDNLFDILTITVPTDKVNQVTINNSRNFYLGFQSENINYPKVGPGPQETALPGFWLNLQDGLEIENLTINLSTSPFELQPSNPPINNHFDPYYN